MNAIEPDNIEHESNAHDKHVAAQAVELNPEEVKYHEKELNLFWSTFNPNQMLEQEGNHP